MLLLQVPLDLLFLRPLVKWSCTQHKVTVLVLVTADVLWDSLVYSSNCNTSRIYMLKVPSILFISFSDGNTHPYNLEEVSKS